MNVCMEAKDENKYLFQTSIKARMVIKNRVS